MKSMRSGGFSQRDMVELSTAIDLYGGGVEQE